MLAMKGKYVENVAEKLAKAVEEKLGITLDENRQLDLMDKFCEVLEKEGVV